jgi:hypothetical protein
MDSMNGNTGKFSKGGVEMDEAILELNGAETRIGFFGPVK